MTYANYGFGPLALLDFMIAWPSLTLPFVFFFFII